MPHERLHPSFNLDEEKINELKQILPEAFADGKINWDVLKECLGDYIEDEDDDVEHFGLFWPGKKDAKRMATIPSKGTLIQLKGDGVNEEESNNVFIEGDNLEVLKVLQKSYSGKIKMIYIDPPYNTGNDFIYDDNFTEPLEDYLMKTGQIDEEGRSLTTNKKSDGRFHSKWLSMMYPRLKYSRDMLRQDGLIFISIDDNEIQNLKLVMNEIFGEENFVDTICWKKKYGGGAKEKYLVSVHEYILIYSKNKSELPEIMVEFDLAKARKFYKHKDENFDRLGYYRTHPLEAVKSFDIRSNLRYPIKAPDGSDVWPKRQWRWSKERFDEAVKNNEVIFSKNKNNEWVLSSKQYLNDESGVQRKTKAQSVIDDIFTQEGTKEIYELFGDAKIFPFPKPKSLLKKLIEIGGVNSDDIVMDFFAGSGTIGDAIFEINSDLKKDIRFILIQMGEFTDPKSEAYKAGFYKISDICKERLKKVVGKTNINFGFTSFKLGKSSFREWRDYKSDNIDTLNDLFSQSTLIPNFELNNLIIEILLIEGFPLQSKKTILMNYNNNNVFQFSSQFCDHYILICLDSEIKKETVDILELNENDIFVCLDDAVSDRDKIILSDKCYLKTI